MSHILGTPYKGNEKSTIKAYNRPATVIEPGLAYAETTVVDVAPFTGAEIIAGVMGGTEHKACSGVVAGLEVFVQVAAAVNSIAITDKVYVTNDGKFTNVADSNTQVNAKWEADASGTILFNDGVVTVGASPRKNQKCAMISFVGGM